MFYQFHCWEHFSFRCSFQSFIITCMASSRRWASLISSIAFFIYFVIIIFQVPIFSVPCRIGICKTPLEVTCSQLIASEVFPHFIVKILLYPTNVSYKKKATLTYSNLIKLHKHNAKGISATSDIQRLEVAAGSYLSVAGAITGLIKPGRMSLFGILLLIWGLIREIIMARSGFSFHAKTIQIYPAMYIALASAFFTIRRDVRKIIRSFIRKQVVKAKCF
ncbi:PREDICTED: uncharacterized protein LOC109357454 [Lupinus angustifolius]|uniref:uncharacterized protein LOC109357454 n=1 Tax=Lupinus angustifolius TaxID=3871 RepID=UPI00092ECC94|nr:PREDICTED: uncharacterized protein LOC109357454 [Lupinus angustifolius]